MNEPVLSADVVIVGSGNAGFCAAHAAAAKGARVLMLEKAPRSEAGGNSYFTAGAFRTVHNGLEDLAAICDPTEPIRPGTILPSYRETDFADDMKRLTDGRCDPVLTELVIGHSRATVDWLHAQGIRWRLMYDRQSYRTADGGHRFWGGLALGTVDGGKGLVQQHTEASERAGIDIRYGVHVQDLHVGANGRIEGVKCTVDGSPQVIGAKAVIVGAGGFQANRSMRSTHLGPHWKDAKVRGTPHNTGDVLRAVLAAGGQAAGDWESAHAVAWDMSGDAERGDRELTNLLTKQSYPLGIVVNRDGYRFLDEGADYRNYTYAKYGKLILEQPGAVSYQLFDAKTRPLLREDEYTAPSVTLFQADTIDDLARRADIDVDGLESTVAAFNQAVQPGTFDPSTKDSKATRGLTPPKSNWALPLDSPPYYAFGVTCGITFTFGGVKVNDRAEVMGMDGQPIGGLYAAGETVGGLFYGNYPGGSGLIAGAVLGRQAGTHAAWDLR